jgi:hypothetical protein
MKYASLLLLLGTCASGCASREYLHADAAAGAGVRVAPIAVWVKGDKLFARLLVSNDGYSSLVVHRAAMTAHPLRETTGALVARTSVERATPDNGFQDDLVSTTIAVAPGEAHLVNVDFRDQGFRWSDVSEVSIDFGESIVSDDGAPLAVPSVLALR